MIKKLFSIMVIGLFFLCSPIIKANEEIAKPNYNQEYVIQEEEAIFKFTLLDATNYKLYVEKGTTKANMEGIYELKDNQYTFFMDTEVLFNATFNGETFEKVAQNVPEDEEIYEGDDYFNTNVLPKIWVSICAFIGSSGGLTILGIIINKLLNKIKKAKEDYEKGTEVYENKVKEYENIIDNLKNCKEIIDSVQDYFKDVNNIKEVMKIIVCNNEKLVEQGQANKCYKMLGGDVVEENKETKI